LVFGWCDIALGEQAHEEGILGTRTDVAKPYIVDRPVAVDGRLEDDAESALRVELHVGADTTVLQPIQQGIKSGPRMYEDQRKVIVQIAVSSGRGKPGRSKERSGIPSTVREKRGNKKMLRLSRGKCLLLSRSNGRERGSEIRNGGGNAGRQQRKVGRQRNGGRGRRSARRRRKTGKSSARSRKAESANRGDDCQSRLTKRAWQGSNASEDRRGARA
jgi:hypothetical protein